MPKSAASAPLSRYAPLLLIVVALLLRLHGITWALPDKTRFFSYHPDETVVVGHALDLDPLAGRVDPNFYNYGSLTLLLDAATIRAGRAAGLVDTAPPDLRPGGLALPTGTELLTARLLSALLGAGTVGFIIGAGRLLYGNAAGLLAGAGYAVAPLAVQHAHFATVDVGGVFWLAGSLYFAARYLVATGYPSPPPQDLLLAGLFAGLSAATKYNNGLGLLCGVAAWWLATPRKPLPLLLLVGGTALGFVAGCPGVFLNTSRFVQNVSEEARHVATGHGELFTGTLPGFIYHIVSSLRWGMTVPLLLFCLLGVGVAAVRRRPADLVLAAFALPYYILIGLAAVKFARYTLPLFPFLLLWAGAAWDDWQRPQTRKAVRGFAAFAIIGALGFSLALNIVMTQTDARDRAAAYIRSLPNVRTVGFAGGPWFYSPTLNPYLAHPYPLVGQETALQNEGLRLVPSVRFGAAGAPERDERGNLLPDEWNAGLLDAPTVPDALAFGELHYNDWLRSRNLKATGYMREANTRYPVHKNFTNPVTLFGVPVVRVYSEGGEPWFGLPTQPLPPDMGYTNPSASVWTKQ